jgi:hypothetical protein
MRIYTTILLSFFLSSLALQAQQNLPDFDPACSCVVHPVKSPVRVFHGHEQSCSFVYFNDINYILELYSDSTFKLAVYDYLSSLKTQSRLSNCGKYEVIDNRIHLIYISSSYQASADLLPEKCPADFTFYRPTGFALSENTITANDGIMPRLSEITLSDLKNLYASLESANTKKTSFLTISQRLALASSDSVLSFSHLLFSKYDIKLLIE